MEQQPLIYSMVARGTVILAEFTELTGNFASTASQYLQRLPPTKSSMFIYNSDGHTFNYLIHQEFTYCVVVEESHGQQIPRAFLERVKEDFTKRYGGGTAANYSEANTLKNDIGLCFMFMAAKLAYCVVVEESHGQQIRAFLERVKEDFTKRYGGGTAANYSEANTLKNDFGPKLKEHMIYCVDHPNEVNKLVAKVEAQVRKDEEAVIKEFEKYSERQALLGYPDICRLPVSLRTEDFRLQAPIRRMWLKKNMNIKLIVVATLIALILIMVISVCGGLHC